MSGKPTNGPSADGGRRDWRHGPIIVTGAASTTGSTVAGLLLAVGVDLSVDPDVLRRPALRYESFERPDLHQFHETLLRGDRPTDEMTGAGAASSDQIELLGLTRRRSAWGWHDPLSSLVLELWDEVFDSAAYVFTYEPPVLPGWPAADDDEGDVLEGWVRSNRLMIDFLMRTPDRCVLIEGRAAADDPVGVLGVLGLDIPCAPETSRSQVVARARTVAARVRAGRPDEDPSLVGKALGELSDDARLVLGELDRLATVRAPQAASVSLALAGLAPPESARGSRSAIVTACRDDGALLVDAIASVQALGPSAPLDPVPSREVAERVEATSPSYSSSAGGVSTGGNPGPVPQGAFCPSEMGAN